MRTIIAALTALALAACTSVKTSVDAYSTLGDEAIGKAVAIKPFNPEDAGSLQWRSNAGILAGELQAKGMRVAQSAESADYIVYFGYAIDKGETVTTQYNTPVYGTVGYNRPYVYGNTYIPGSPQTGVVGYVPNTSSNTVYTRSLAVDIVERGSGNKVFEARSTSRGTCSRFSGVAPEIIASSLKDFPKAARGSVEIPYDGDC